MKLNTNKCCSLSFGKGDTTLNFYYCINDVSLSRLTEFNDLGITLCGDLSQDKHISQRVTKANKGLGLLKRRDLVSFREAHGTNVLKR